MAFNKSFTRMTLLTLLLLALAACGGGSEPAAMAEPTAAPAEPTATPDPLEGWVTYSPTDGSFTVRMPEEPKVDEQTVATDAGDISVAMYSVERSNNMVMVSQNGFPSTIVELLAAGDETVIKSMLDGGRDGAVSNVNGTFQSEHDVTVNGFPGREFTFTIDEANSPTGGALLGTARVILTKDRLFQLIALESQDKTDPAMVQNFFDSFQLAVGQ